MKGILYLEAMMSTVEKPLIGFLRVRGETDKGMAVATRDTTLS